MTVGHSTIEGRQLTRGALADEALAYVRVWRCAQQMQAENPGMRELGLAGNPDPVEAVADLVPILAFTHPAVAPAIMSFLEAIVAELLVTPPCEHVFVGKEATGRSQREDDRLAVLEEENEWLRERVQRLEAAMTLAAAAIERAAMEPTA